MPKSFRKSKWSYFFEFIIIIAGISVSFILNEWRETKKVETKKEHLLIDINHDLYSDSLVLENMVRFYTTVARSHDSLLAKKEGIVNKDSITNYLDHVTSYYPFSETANTYKRINSDSELSIERKDSLIWFYLNLHNIVYPSMHEWLFVEKDFVLKTALPYMDRNAPFIYPSPVDKSFDGQVFYELRKEDEFMNYLKSGRVYKQSMLKVSYGVLRYIKHLKVLINNQIAENKLHES